MIGSLTRNWRDEADKESLDAQLRVRWLDSVKGQGNKDADLLFDHCASIIRAKTGIGKVAEKSPISQEMLLGISIQEQIQVLNQYKPTGFFGDLTVDGLAELLANSVKEQPDRYQDNLGAFLKTKPVYQMAILRAYEESWREKRVVKWDEVLNFCWLIMQSDVISSGELDSVRSEERAIREQLICTIASLIESGVKGDEWSFDEAYLPVVEKLIVKMLEEVASSPSKLAAKEQDRTHLLQYLNYEDTDPWEQDAATHSMNTTRGRCLEALIRYCLRQARIFEKKKQSKDLFWQRIKAVFDREIAWCSEGNLEFSTLAGLYLPNLYYLSKDWVESNLNSLFPQTYNINWRCAMQGYSYVEKVYKQIYDLLKTNGHFAKALELEFKNSQVHTRVIQNAAIAYMTGWESLSDPDGLFALVLNGWRKDYITEVVSTLWMSRDGDVDVERRERILNFWRYCFEKIDNQEEANKDLLSHLNLLAAFLTQISEEEKQWLLQCAPFVDIDHNASFLIEYLEQLAAQNSDAVGEVYLKMLTNATPTYDDNLIRSIVEKLFQAGNTQTANQICDSYARRGFPEMLRSLYERYNSRSSVNQ